MNVQYSSASNEWYTPRSVIELCRRVLGDIDCDPASCDIANRTVGARVFYTEEDNGLNNSWFGSVFCNPPGGRLGNKSVSGLFWHKLMQERALGHIDHAVFLCFSIETLRVTQRYTLSACDFPVCIPAKRLRYSRSGTNAPGTAPHASAIVYVPGHRDLSPMFRSVFAELGKVIG